MWSKMKLVDLGHLENALVGAGIWIVRRLRAKKEKRGMGHKRKRKVLWTLFRVLAELRKRVVGGRLGKEGRMGRSEVESLQLQIGCDTGKKESKMGWVNALRSG
jgi:hypothetical protein